MVCASIADKVNFAFFKWELSILAFLLLIALLIGRGKRVKRAIVFLLITVPLLFAASLDHLAISLLLKKETPEFARVLITFAPTVTFLLTLLYCTLWGMWRGFRKSEIGRAHV